MLHRNWSQCTIFASWVKSLVKKAPLGRKFCKTKRFIVFYVFSARHCLLCGKTEKIKGSPKPWTTRHNTREPTKSICSEKWWDMQKGGNNNRFVMGKCTKYSSRAWMENSDWVIHEIENDWAGDEKKQWNSETVKLWYFCLLLARICSCSPQQNNKTLAACLLCRQNKGKLGFKTKGNTAQIIVVSLFSGKFHFCPSIKTLFRLIWGFSL